MIMSTTCDNCGKKIGMLERKCAWEDKTGNPLVYCKECNDTLKEELEEKEAIETEQKTAAELKKILQKNAQYEYKIVNLNSRGTGLNAAINAVNNKLRPEDEKLLNELGSEGWELVSAVAINSLATRVGVASTATEWVSCIFKRKL